MRAAAKRRCRSAAWSRRPAIFPLYEDPPPMTSLWTRAGLTWKEIGMRLWRQIWEDELLGRCAELAYFFLFSIFPLLLFLTTLLGYLAQASAELRVNLFNYLARISPSRDVVVLL